MQTKQFSIAFPSSSVLSVLAVTREIDHESMRQFYLNFRHIFRCNLRESWRANTVRPKSICIRNSILVFDLKIFFSKLSCVSFISILYTIFVAMSENLGEHEVPHSALHSKGRANSNSQF